MYFIFLAKQKKLNNLKNWHHGSQRRKLTGIQSGKEVKLSLFADDMILSIENNKDAARKLLEFINELVKLQDTKLTHYWPGDFCRN